MRRPFTILILCSVIWLAASARAQSNKPVPLGVVIQKEDLHFAEDIYRALVTMGTNKFAFFLPEEFRLDNNPLEGSIKLINREGNCRIVFSIVGPAPESGVLDTETYRTLVLEQHPGAKIVQEFGRGVDGRIGPGFDMQWRGPGATMQSARALFVPSPFGVLKFLAVSTPGNEKLMQDSFGRIIGTFWISKDGKFEVLRPFTGS
ncbi:MAG TPA: hypothetical protein VN281_20225 [Verrucomicrobiae bacterium]|jgi:hypothetical protein|nr:hypothetical protein [Verrucomicrobiae bacterium]